VALAARVERAPTLATFDFDLDFAAQINPFPAFVPTLILIPQFSALFGLSWLYWLWDRHLYPSPTVPINTNGANREVHASIEAANTNGATRSGCAAVLTL